MKIYSYKCYHKEYPQGGQVIMAFSRGQAKAEYLRDIRDPFPSAKFTDIRSAKLAGTPTDPRLKWIAKKRGLPFLRIGIKVRFAGGLGEIIGSCEAGNIRIYMESGKYAGQRIYNHPKWDIEYLDENGESLANFLNHAETAKN